MILKKRFEIEQNSNEKLKKGHLNIKAFEIIEKHCIFKLFLMLYSKFYKEIEK